MSTLKLKVPTTMNNIFLGSLKNMGKSDYNYKKTNKKLVEASKKMLSNSKKL